MSDTMTADEYRKTQRKGSKYRNKRVRIGPVTFASMAEGARYIELMELETYGAIERLRFQPRYPIEIGGVRVFTYVADFEYWDTEREELVIEDVKGGSFRTDVYKIKKRVFEAVYDRTITEVSDVDTTGMAQYVIGDDA